MFQHILVGRIIQVFLLIHFIMLLIHGIPHIVNGQNDHFEKVSVLQSTNELKME